MNNAATKITPKLHINKVLSARIVGTQLARDTAKIVRGNLGASRIVHDMSSKEINPKARCLVVRITFLLVLATFVIGLLSGCTYRDESPSMKECEKVYSYETCLHILR